MLDMYYDTDIDIQWVNAEDVRSRTFMNSFGDIDGILVPGGFGDRGVDGKIAAIQYARENNIPFFGICISNAELASVQFARNVRSAWKGRSRPKIDPNTPHPVIDLLPEQKEVSDIGGTFRLARLSVQINGRPNKGSLRWSNIVKNAPPPVRI